MKYLFIIQGEGRGHLTQAMTMEKLLRSRGHEVVEMLVGKSESRKLPSFFLDGVNFVSAAADKRPDAVKSVLYNIAVSPKFIPSVSLIRSKIKESGADVILNFYELLGTIAHGLTGRRIPGYSRRHGIPDFPYRRAPPDAGAAEPPLSCRHPALA